MTTVVHVSEQHPSGGAVFTYPDTVTEIRDRWAARVVTAPVGPSLLLTEQACDDVEELARLLRSAREATLRLDWQNDELARQVAIQAQGHAEYVAAVKARHGECCPPRNLTTAAVVA